MDYKIGIHFIISIPQQLVIRWRKSIVTSPRQNEMYISPFVDDNEESEYEDEDENIFDVFNEEIDDE